MMQDSKLNFIVIYGWIAQDYDMVKNIGRGLYLIMFLQKFKDSNSEL